MTPTPIASNAAPAAPDASRRPLRVLHVITRMIVGGAQENTMLSCALIDRSRFPSELLTGPQTGAEGDLLTECRARQVPVHVEPWLVREVSPLKDLIALFRLVAFIRRGRYDVVHTHCSKAGVLGRIAAWVAGTPVVIHTMHGLPFNRTQSKLGYWANVWIEHVCVRCSGAVVMVARRDLDETIAHGIGRPDQYVVIRSGIEVDAYRDAAIARAAARALAGVPADAFVIGTVGRLSLQKAPMAMLDAFARVAAVRPDAHLVMVGDGDLRPEVEARLTAAPWGSRVRLLGLRRDVPELLRAFDVFALPSLYEGLPRVFPQAMAARLPIVATRVDGAMETIEPGASGWLVDIGDMEAMAARLLELADDPERARAMGRRGLERVEEFSARRMVQQLEQLYERLAAAKRLIPARSASAPPVAAA